MFLEGQNAPDFRLQGSDGKAHTLGDYRGKLLVLFFYPRDNTPGCTAEAVGFAKLHPLFEQLGAVLVGVSKDSMKSHDKFIADFKLPFTLLSDPDASVMRSYGAFGEKVQYGKTTMGTIRSTVVISPDGIVIKHWPKVPKASEHPDKVLDFFKMLAKGR
ncbi:peroxiredoxin [Geomonas sp. Red69]|uniref:thioredoxin-dependent peroxiredoxin n=1 Tax=Geomonas diazotrophica TaxID=2843197 RepID=A0ABX8JHT9_9BACT|nr:MULTISPECIES: peroxiredoxin [Geomonas]MBU5635393.1 peroxiredoxin [Geomonas diazotrophica]QWV97551.1 peroxiredoxin [Geomonas nitrogeniifigens]QXE86692.1 peroxiredoxin [Geomonas nitrogeniifigens]